MPRPARPAGAALWAPMLNRTAATPLSRQLAASLRQAITEARFGIGARLPSTRVLATELGIARSTVVGVFEQLAAEGYIVARPGSGYFVPTPIAATRSADVAGEPIVRKRSLSRQARVFADLPPPSRGPTLRPFEPGHPEIEGRLVATWKRLASRAFSGRSSLAWGYGEPQGEAALRGAIAEYLAAARGVRCRAEQVIITSGTQQGLSLTTRLLLDQGDVAWVEDPCYRAAYEILRAAEARIVPVPIDVHGLDIAAAPPDAPSPRLVYTTPSRQYPLGMAMPLARRAALLAWAEKAGAWIVEDDYESEFQQPSRILPSLQGLDRAGRVIYLGTFSKLLFPSLRLGYAVLPEDLVAPFTTARYLSDRQGSAVLQAIMTEFILDGHFARHLKRMRMLYAARHEFLADRIARRLGRLVGTRPGECGMYLIGWLPTGWSDRAIASALASVGVVALPLSSLTLATPRPPGLVLGYTGHSEAAMARAVDRMAQVLDRQSGMAKQSELELQADQ